MKLLKKWHLANSYTYLPKSTPLPYFPRVANHACSVTYLKLPNLKNVIDITDLGIRFSFIVRLSNHLYFILEPHCHLNILKKVFKVILISTLEKICKNAYLY